MQYICSLVLHIWTFCDGGKDLYVVDGRRFSSPLGPTERQLCKYTKLITANKPQFVRLMVGVLLYMTVRVDVLIN